MLYDCIVHLLRCVVLVFFNDEPHVLGRFPSDYENIVYYTIKSKPSYTNIFLRINLTCEKIKNKLKPDS